MCHAMGPGDEYSGALNLISPYMSTLVLTRGLCERVPDVSEECGLWPDEEPALPSKERRLETPGLKSCAPVLYSTRRDVRGLTPARHRGSLPAVTLLSHPEGGLP